MIRGEPRYPPTPGVRVGPKAMNQNNGPLPFPQGLGVEREWGIGFQGDTTIRLSKTFSKSVFF